MPTYGFDDEAIGKKYMKKRKGKDSTRDEQAPLLSGTSKRHYEIILDTLIPPQLCQVRTLLIRTLISVPKLLRSLTWLHSLPATV